LKRSLQRLLPDRLSIDPKLYTLEDIVAQWAVNIHPLMIGMKLKF
jgi:hypothetical protein